MSEQPSDGAAPAGGMSGPDGGGVSVLRHPRRHGENRYVYPVLSRRARGISIGINLNPDKICNFDCIYCQVDRRTPPAYRDVDEALLYEELRSMLGDARSGALFARPEFGTVPDAQRVIRDITFAGDGEPPSYPRFREVVKEVLAIRRDCGFEGLKVVLLTNATLIDRPAVQEAMRLMDEDHGEFWLKLDAGSEEYYRLIDRTTIPFAKVLRNILQAARIRPVVLQSLFMSVHGAPPSPAEIAAFCERVREILTGGGSIRLIQAYTVARAPAEEYVTALSDAELDALADELRRRLPVAVETFYGDR